MDHLDLRNIENYNSLERNLYREMKQINLSDFDLDPFDYSGFDIERSKLPSQYNQEASEEERYAAFRNSFKFIQNHTPFYPSKRVGIERCVQELLRNAQKHGNKNNPSKKIGIGYQLTPSSFHVFVEDKGGCLDANFLSYTKYLQDLKQRDVPTNDWKTYHTGFCREENPPGNAGSGTILAYLFADDVGYFKSELGGLLVKTRFDF